MLLKYSFLLLGAAGFVMAQHGGTGGGGGGHHSGGGGGIHASSGPSVGHSGNSGYTTGITPQSYSGHLPFSTPGMGTTGLNHTGGARFGDGRANWGRPPIRRPGGENDRFRGIYGIGYYPVFGYGYYGDDYGSPYYGSQAMPEDQYIPQQQYEGMPEGYGDYPPIPYAMNPEPQPAPPVVAAPAPEPPAVPITIVLKSGQKMQIHSYAIMNGTLWDFSKQNTKRIPLKDIDGAASAKATDEAGGTFPEESFVARLK